MNRLLKPFLIFGLTALSKTALADSLSLDQALKEAQAGALEIQVSQASQEENEWGVTEARAPFLPSFNIDAAHYFNIRYQNYTFNLPSVGAPLDFPFVTPATLYTLSGNWSIFNGFQDQNRLAASKLKKEASDRDLDWAKFQVDQTVKLNFFESIAARQLEAAAEANVANLEHHLKEVQDLLKEGEAIEVDVLRVQVQLNNARAQLINAQDNITISQQHLAQSLGKAIEARTPEGTLPIPDPDIANRIESASRDENNHFLNRADIQASGLRSEAAEKTATAAANYWIPTLSIVGNYQFYNNTNFDVVTPTYFKSAWQYGLELKWNIFDGNLSHAKAREAAAETLRQTKSEQLARLQAATDSRTNSNDYRYQLTQYQASSENLERSKRSVDLALSGLRYGTQTNTDVLDAELDLFNARSGVIQSEIKALEAQIKFENAIGRKI